ncbi:hypothetical protein [Acidaminococcus massiliensis]|uniref:hypothetical protein n=1 Tax=Acidaminococcus massiliensis TaxID=1852375 RepID=UPI00248DD8C7|nr:hypothetical protein [Acidaminococcus massiliensis]
MEFQKEKYKIKVEFKELAFFSYFILLLWAFCNVFLGPEIKAIVKLQYVIIILGLFLGTLFIIDVFNKKGKLFLTKQLIFAIVIILASLILSCIGSFNQLIVTIRVYIILGIILFYLRYKDIVHYKNMAKLLYWAMFLFILYNFIFTETLNSNFYIPSLMDKNYTGILVFLFFMLSLKLRTLSGLVLSCFYMFFLTNSRSFYGMVAIFLLLKFFRKNIIWFINFLHLRRTLSQFCVLFLGVVILSIFWINYVSVNPLAHYKEGLNDGSNKMRFVANVYALNKMKDDPRFIYKGLGDHIKETLGVASEDYSQHTKVMGVRLVQPHNCFINMMLKIGIIESIIYFCLLAYLLDKIRSCNNIEYYFPYIINACFMHSLLDGPFLVIWTFILILSQESELGVHNAITK